ncbi:MAG TPA: glycoside hydrolase family 172 protein, partial [Abditibacteriaceae bacterium]|nr:glycoside hydrolase family 172 protein [Abditibacteriaceae bacterium]
TGAERHRDAAVEGASLRVVEPRTFKNRRLAERLPEEVAKGRFHGGLLFAIPNKVHTRWASAENDEARTGAGGQANFGRKGSPSRSLASGESLTLAHAAGMGTVRRMWITINDRSPHMLRGLVLRMFWDGEEKPAVEAPFGDFFGQALGQPAIFQSAWFDNPEGRSFNCRIPMPFRTGFKITVTNESPNDLGLLFYDVNFTLGDEHGLDAGYFHAHYRRENPTSLRRDFHILPRVVGRGRFLGCTLGVLADTARYGKSWWGEGEVKIYLDGDEYPTLCGTGTEDYIATGWGQGQYSHLWHGCPVADDERMRYSFYRLHGPDAVYFHHDIRVTIQQIGCASTADIIAFMQQSATDYLLATGDGNTRLTVASLETRPAQEYILFERQDDWCATAYFYLDRPANELPAIQEYALRVAGLSTEN